MSVTVGTKDIAASHSRHQGIFLDIISVLMKLSLVRKTSAEQTESFIGTESWFSLTLYM